MVKQLKAISGNHEMLVYFLKKKTYERDRNSFVSKTRTKSANAVSSSFWRPGPMCPRTVFGEKHCRIVAGKAAL